MATDYFCTSITTNYPSYITFVFKKEIGFQYSFLKLNRIIEAIFLSFFFFWRKKLYVFMPSISISENLVQILTQIYNVFFLSCMIIQETFVASMDVFKSESLS